MQVQLNKQFEQKGLNGYSINMVFDPQDKIDTVKPNKNIDVHMKDASSKRFVKKAHSFTSTKARKFSDISNNTNSTGNTSNENNSMGNIDSGDRVQEEAKVNFT